jgi:ribosomal 50S subunit-recycling heat shock protein
MSAARLDVWLWRARVFRTRSLAAAAVTAGAVRIVRQDASRVADKPGFTIKPGDGLCIRIGARLRTLTVLALAERRGPAREAQLLYAESTAELDAPADAPHLSLPHRKTKQRTP